ncbi:MAG TPA: AAA family ATPase [Streptosporangiaceae bacterium]
MGWDAPTTAPRLELRLAGAFGVIRDGRELADGEVGSRKSRTLLKLLAVERPGLVPVDRIIDVLWPGTPPAAAEQNVASLVSRLRSALGAGVIQGGRQGYRLAGREVLSVDLDTAADLCDQAERKLTTAAALALAAAARAADLLAAGTAISDEPYATWADPARAELNRLLRRARLSAAQAALATGDPALAARYAEAAMSADPLDEAAHRWYMSASAAAGEPARALTAYAALRERLGEELGAEPAPQTQELHLAILREQAGAVPGRAAGRVARAGAGAPAAGGPKLAGRDAELAALRQAWGQAAAGEPSLIMIVGEAGIGKTTLAEALTSEAVGDGATVLRSRCYETERSLFLQPIVEAITPAVAALPAGPLERLLGEHAPAAAALLPDVAALPGPPARGRGPVEMERRRAFEAVTALLRGLAARNPVLLLVDDLQYAGQSTVELIHFLGRHFTGSRLLAVVTLRAEQEAEIGTALAPVARRLEVGPLVPAAVEQLAREAGQGDLAGDIQQRTRGHTLFVVEVLRTLAGGDEGVPESLRSAVQARVQRAGTAVETLLRAAAVAGATVDPLELAALLDLPPTTALELCEQALRARLLVVSGREYEFANDLIREVLYATTPVPSRLAYHRRAADLLTGQPESLARHAAAAGDWQRAGRAWLQAADDAMSRYSASDAVALARQALDAAVQAGDTEIRARALVLRGRAHDAAGDHAGALKDLTEGIAGARATGDRRLEMFALRQLGGDVPVSRGLPIAYFASNLESGLRIAESLGDRAAEADVLSRLAVIEANRLRLDAALGYGLRAVSSARAAADDQALAAALDGLKTARLSLGDSYGLREVLAELTPLLRRLGDLFHLQWAEFESAFLDVAAADWDAATTAIETAIDINRRGGYPQSTAWYTAHLGWVARLRGRDAEAVTLGRRAVSLATQHEHIWWQAATGAMLGDTLLLAGDVAGAVELFERGLAAAQEAGVEAYLLRCLAPLAAATGSPAVLAEAAGVLAAASIPEGGAWLLGADPCISLAHAWLGQDEPEGCRNVLAPLLAVTERGRWLPTLAAALTVDGRALIRLGERELAAARLRQAEELAREHGLPHVLRDATAALTSLR